MDWLSIELSKVRMNTCAVDSMQQDNYIKKKVQTVIPVA